MKNSIGLFIVFCIHAHLVFGQHEIIEKVDIERVIENILPQQEVDLDYNDLYDRLFSLYVNPLDFNTADRTEFQSLFFLSEEQISGVIEYRKEYGNFLTLFELLSVDGFDKETIERLSAFVTINQLQVQSLKHS